MSYDPKAVGRANRQLFWLLINRYRIYILAIIFALLSILGWTRPVTIMQEVDLTPELTQSPYTYYKGVQDGCAVTTLAVFPILPVEEGELDINLEARYKWCIDVITSTTIDQMMERPLTEEPKAEWVEFWNSPRNSLHQ